MAKVNITTPGGDWFLALLQVLFIGLKLTHTINWSWWWVMAPIWMPIALVLGVIVFLLIIAGIVSLFR